MCGFAGIISMGYPSCDPRMMASSVRESLRHRGPDSEGEWHEQKTCSISLVHTRLAIVDISPLASQPMHSPCGRYVLAFNGELYNREEIRSRLTVGPGNLRSGSDTEVLLHVLMERWSDGLSMLRGMYAFVIWDRQEQRALLARDPFGIKPLYLDHGGQGQLSFASEVRTLLRMRTQAREVDSEAVASFLSWGFIPEPRTLVKGIASLPAGCFGEWRHGRWRQGRHWHAPCGFDATLQEGEAAALVRSALRDSIAIHQCSDVPVGLCLSGGRDSASLMALSPTPMACFTLGFEEQGFDESGIAAVLAREFGLDHRVQIVDQYAAAQQVQGYLRAMDQPSTDGFNTYCLTGFIRNSGWKVALTGMGGDELFGGYPTFERIPQLLQWHADLGARRKALARLHGQSSNAEPQRLAAFLNSDPTLANAYRCLRGLFSPQEVKKLLQFWGLSVEVDVPVTSSLMRGSQSFGDGEGSDHPAAEIASLELHHYMSGQLLRDADVFAMAHGVEMRLPMVDPQLFAAVSRVPPALRFGGGKRLLQLATPELDPLLGSVPKRGFSFPFQRWLDDRAGPLATAMNQASPLACAEGIDTRPWQRRWALMVLGSWLSTSMGCTFNCTGPRAATGANS